MLVCQKNLFSASGRCEKAVMDDSFGRAGKNEPSNVPHIVDAQQNSMQWSWY